MTPVLKGVFTDYRLRQRGQGAAGARRPRLYRRMGHGAVRARRPHRHDLRGRQRRAGARPRRPQAAEGRRPRDHGLLRRGQRSSSPPTRTTRRSRPISAACKTALGHLQQATMWLMQNGLAEPGQRRRGLDRLHASLRPDGARLHVGADRQGGARAAGEGREQPGARREIDSRAGSSTSVCCRKRARIWRASPPAPATVMALPAEAF